jgi:Chromo (CHRromatin Organisation MOdifier) domain
MSTIHTSRVKFFQQKELGRMEELHDFPQCQSTTLYVVEDLIDLRRNGTKTEVLVQWLGFPTEDTWEDVSVITEDAPDIFQKTLRARKGCPIATEFRK